MIKKHFWLGMLIVALAFGMMVVGCDDGSGGGDDDGDGGGGDGWWTWVSSQKDGNYVSTANVSITPTADNTGCAVIVTGTANSNGYNWATQVGKDYTAKVGKTYKVSWKWKAEDSPFQQVTIRYAQQKDNRNDAKYQFGTNTNKLTIPTTEETKTYTFTMPANCYMTFTFEIGEDTGSFTISDFKVEEQAASSNDDEITLGSWTYSAWGDKNDGGTSTITMSESSGAITISGNITLAYQHGYAGCSAIPNATELASLKTAKSISFKVKGDGKTYRFELPQSDITDYSYYRYRFTAPSTETTITVNLQSGSGTNNLTNPGWGQSSVSNGKAFDKSKVTNIQWVTNDQNYTAAPFSLTISDLTLHQN